MQDIDGNTIEFDTLNEAEQSEAEATYQSLRRWVRPRRTPAQRHMVYALCRKAVNASWAQAMRDWNMYTIRRLIKAKLGLKTSQA